MNITDEQQSQITFISGVTPNGRVSATSYTTWDGAVPVTYGTSTSPYLGKWGGNTAAAGATVTYKFNPSSNWTTDEKAAWKAGFALWANVANITFSSEINDRPADILITRGTDGAEAFVDPLKSTVGSDILPVAKPRSGNINVDTNSSSFGPIGTNYNNPDYNYPFVTIVHEIGHVIGLGHAGPYNLNVQPMTQQFSKYDMYIWSTMSYISPETRATKYFDEYPVNGTDYGKFTSPQSPMILDIAAAQQLYGASTNGVLSTGGNVFGFNSNVTGDAQDLYNFSANKTPIISLWSGGKNNTLDLSGYNSDNSVNLDPGTFSSVAGLKNNLSIAFNTTIETGIGGSGDDKFIGSIVNNYFKGNGGNDHLDGAGGLNYAIYNNSINKYDITISAADDAFEVFDKSGVDGNDLIINIHELNFSDRSLSSSDFFTVRSLSEAYLEKLNAFYVEIAQRAPDSLGVIFWGARLVEGASLKSVASDIFNSAEGQRNYSPTQTTQEFVQAAYQSSFNRPAEQGGLDYWSGLIDTGKISRSDLFVYLAETPGTTVDGKTLINKTTAAGYFSTINGLNDSEWAKEAIAGVDSSNESLSVAYDRIDAFSDIASSVVTSQLTVKLLGIDPFRPYPS